MRRKTKQNKTKTEMSINEEPKLRSKSQITVIIIAQTKPKRGYKLFDTFKDLSNLLPVS